MISNTEFTIYTAINAFAVIVLARGLDRLREWKKQIEGKTEFGEWLLISKQEWDDFRKYFYAFEYEAMRRIRNLEEGQYPRGAIVPNKWKPWAR